MIITNDRTIWQAYIRESDTEYMSEEQEKLFVQALNSAVQKVCWEHGLHNQRRIIRQKGQAMSEPMYLQGDDFALDLNPCSGCDEKECVCDEDDSGLPDRMWEDDE